MVRLLERYRSRWTSELKKVVKSEKRTSQRVHELCKKANMNGMANKGTELQRRKLCAGSHTIKDTVFNDGHRMCRYYR